MNKAALMIASTFRRTLLLTAMLAVAAPLLTAAPASAADVADRETSAVVYGNDACPRPHDENEVVVCARRPESERYRIPPALRHLNRRIEQSWGANVAALEDAQRDTRPDSCSPVGSFGQTGCQAAAVRQWYAERAARR